MAQELRKRLASLERSERWLDRRALAPVLAELASQRQAIATAMDAQAPALAVELLWRLLELAPALLDRVDDSDGAGLALFHRLSASLEALASRARLPVATLVAHLAEALTPEGLQSLRRRLEQERPAPAGAADELVEDEPDNGDELALAPWRRRQNLRLAQLAIADGLADAEGYLAEDRDHAPAGLRRPRLVARIAQRLTAAGLAAQALAVLDGAELPQGLRSDGARPWLDGRVGALKALGRGDEAQALRRRFALERLSLPHLRAYLQRLPPFEDGEAEEALLEAVLQHPSFDGALEFLHRWPDQRRAARLVLADPERLDGGDETLRSAVAAGLEARHPLAASLCLRAMIEKILELARTSRYPRAVRHIESCRQLARGIADWARIPPHNTYVRGLLRAYGHRLGFLKQLDREALLLPE